MVYLIILLTILQFLSFFLILLLFKKNPPEEVDRYKLLDRYETILSILNESMRISYEKVWKEDIYVHLTSGYRLDEKELSKFGKKFIQTVFMCCGNRIVEDLEIIHGSIEAISIHLLSTFLVKVLEDESTFKSSIDFNGEK